MTIFLVLAQFSHFSDVLRSRLMALLSERFRIIVITPVIDQTVAERDGFPIHPNIEYRKLALARPKFWSVSDKYLRVPLVRAFDHLTYMHHFYRRPHWWVRKLLMRLRLLFPAWLFTPDRITRWELARMRPTEEFRELVRRSRPVLLITATPGFTAFEAEQIISAKSLGLKTAAININYDNLASNGKMIRKTDFLAVWNGIMEREALDLHRYPRERLAVVGCLRFDHYFTDPADPRFPSREAFLRSKGLDPAKKTVVLAGPTPSNYPPRKELVGTLIRMKRDGALERDPNVLIRIHPIDKLETYRDLQGVPGVAIERAGRSVLPDTAGGQKIEMGTADLINLTATLKYADVVLNFASTVIMEAAIFDRPVINIGFPEYRRIVYEFEYNKGLLDTGAVRLARDPDELARQINQYLAHPELDRQARARLLDRYIPFRDGRTWVRTGQFISHIVHATRKGR